MARRHRVGILVGAGVALLSSGLELSPGAASAFEPHVIATGLTGGYQTVVADLNRDDRPDVIGLSIQLDELAWFENPGWQRHVLATGLNRAINVAPHDLDGDGIPELVLAHEFGTTHDTSLGVLSLLTHQGDPTEPWAIEEIDRAPTTHRLKWADIDGSGRRVLVNAPLSGPDAAAPDYRDDVPIYWYDPDGWSRHVVTDRERGVVHGLLVKPWSDADRDAIFTASFLGVHVHRYGDGQWSRRQLTAGDSAEWPASGSSEVETGRLGDATFITTVEPWHGNQVVVYRGRDDSWARQVIGTIESGHTIVTADFDGDGRDEVVTGGRGEPPTLNLYSAADAEGETWSRQVLDDGGMSASSCVAADLNTDGRPDLVCIGGGTANLKWYENVAP